MPATQPTILTINGGSSTIRFAFYRADESLDVLLRGKLERIGMPGTSLQVSDLPGDTLRTVDIPDRVDAVDFLFDWLEAKPLFATVKAVGHRVVHGMHHADPAVVTPELLAELQRIAPLDPEHLPGEIALIKRIQERQPELRQIACFDTAFHRSMPSVAKLLPIPRRYQAQGVERYGFHGLSYAYLLEELVRLGDPAATTGRVILAHLGNGASMAAVRDGKSIDTSMGFTPASGLMMSTRSGDIDPGVGYYLSQSEQLSAQQLQHMLSHESGLLGVSGISSDIRDLLARESNDAHAADAVSLFCYQAKKWLGSFSAVLGGLDTLVFAGGIGENAPRIRARICDRLNFLGIELDDVCNARNSDVISSKSARVTVRVIRTDEERMIARSVVRACSA